MRSLVRLSLAAAAALLAPSLAQARVHIIVDLDKQVVHVDAGPETYEWKVSSGKAGYDTPVGKFNVLWMDKDHHSDEYEQAPMPNSIFFAPGFALHGFGKSAWGHKASHGCVRLPVAQSAILFNLVKAQGADIEITGVSPVTAATIQAKRREVLARAAETSPIEASRLDDLPRRAPQEEQASGLRSLLGSFY